MIYNRFYIQVLIRVVLISLNSFVFIYFIYKPDKPVTLIFFGLLLVFQTFKLIYYVNRTNRDLARFLIYLKEGDTSLTITSQGIEKTFKSLNHSFELINKQLQKTRIEKEAKEQFLNTIVEHVTIGLIAFDELGNIFILNRTAKELMSIKNEICIQTLQDFNKNIQIILGKITPNETRLVKLKSKNKDGISNSEFLHLSFNATSIKIQGETIKLVALQDIKNELEENELESWQKLIRTLTHEIMNSMTPITTLTTAIRRNLKQNNKLKPIHEITNDTIYDVLNSTDVIENRSIGLINFVNNYRNLTKTPNLNIQTFLVSKLLMQLELLLQEDLNKKDVKLISTIFPENTELTADKNLIEQVLINLIKNAIEAIEINTGIIEIKVYLENEKIILQVIDNGAGIPEENIDRIFIPFYTTKENGTGIGLSWSKQIMRLHKGNISIKSQVGKGSIATIFF